MKNHIPEFRWLYEEGFQVLQSFGEELKPLIENLSGAKSFEETLRKSEEIEPVLDRMFNLAGLRAKDSPALAHMISMLACAVENLVEVHKSTWPTNKD